MARFSGTQLPQATYNASADKSGQFIAQGISQAGAALGQGLKEYIKGNVKKKRDDEQISVMTDFLWDQGTAKKWGVESKEELAKMGKGARGFGGLIKMYNDKRTQEVQDLQHDQLQLQYSTLLKQNESNTLRQQNFSSGQQISSYIDTKTKQNHGPDGLPAEEFARQNPILFQLIQAEAAGADPTQVKALYDRLVTPSVKFGTVDVAGGKVATMTGPDGVPKPLPSGSVYRDKSGLQPITGPDGTVVGYQNVGPDGNAIGKVIYTQDTGPDSPLGRLQTAQKDEGTSEDTVEKVMLRERVSPNASSTPQELQKMADEAVKVAGDMRTGFSTAVTNALKDKTIQVNAKSIKIANRTNAMLKTAIEEGNLPSQTGAVKSFISLVEDGIVTDPEMDRFKESGAWISIKERVRTLKGDVTPDVINMLKIATAALEQEARDNLVEQINRTIDAQRKVYSKIPGHEAESMVYTSAQTELGLKKEFVMPNYPEGVRRRDSVTYIKLKNPPAGGGDEKPIDHFIAIMGRKGFSDEKILEALSQDLDPDVAQYILKKLREFEKTQQGGK